MSHKSQIIKEVEDILCMWETIAKSLLIFEIEESVSLTHYNVLVRFPGFGYTDEIEHYSIAEELINRENRWWMFRNQDLSYPGHEILPIYRKMLQLWPEDERLGSVLSKGKFRSLLTKWEEPLSEIIPSH